MNMHTTLGDNWILLGDTAYIAYISQDFRCILTPVRDNGLLTRRQLSSNTALSRGRVIIENTFGRLKCRFRRLRDIQNVGLDNVVGIILGACALHSITTGSSSDLCNFYLLIN